ncbi:hypothetical protein HZS61_007442 [Fusarium oxysporum f. sp. conglutinans]|uniref:Cytochrome P450 n=1 Tax=Fusarium oxysporum f. sp. conglutinans TaxID=100902 RepID=A0A8H6LAX3_FUSOX|nr:hypothetical protein HZS61_007442 [Fusarium oxysporum f. sp. conglutinans]
MAQWSITDSHALRTIYNVSAPFPKDQYYEPFNTAGVRVDVFTEKSDSRHDCMCDFTFDQNQGYIDHSCNDEIFHYIDEFVLKAHLWGMIPTLSWILKPLQSIRDRIIPKKHSGNIIERAIKSYFDSMSSASDSLAEKPQRNIASKLLNIQATNSSNGLNDAEVMHLITFGLTAGTTDGGTWLSSILWHLMHNRDVLDKLMIELQEKFRKGELSRICSAQQAATCTYLDAVLQESLRMLPPLGGILPRTVPKGGMEVCGFKIPPGVMVGVPAYATQRLEEYFGSDPFSFRPERWLEGNRLPDMSRLSFGFGTGSRTCLGKNLGWLTMRKIVPSLLLALDIETPDPDIAWEVVAGAGIHTHKFYARVRARE